MIPSSGNATIQPQPPLETARAAHDALKDALAVEEQRHSILIAKSQTLVTVAAIIFASLGISNFSFLVSKVLAVISFIVGIVSIRYSLEILKSREFWGIDRKNILADSALLVSPELMLISLARTYDEAIDKTKPVVDDLHTTFDDAVKFLKWSAGLALLAFIFQLGLGEYMNTNNNGNQGSSSSGSASSTTTSTTTTTTLANVTPSFGTVTVKRSIVNTPTPPPRPGDGKKGN